MQDKEFVTLIGGPHDGQVVQVVTGIPVFHFYVQDQHGLVKQKYTRREFMHKSWLSPEYVFGHESLTDEEVRVKRFGEQE